MIIGYFGLPGAGKTYLATRDFLQYKKKDKNKNLFSNIPVEGAYKLTFNDLTNFFIPTNSVLLLDEVQYWASSRDWSNLPLALYNYFSQSRKMGIDLLYTAQDSSRVDKTLREVTNYFYDISRFGRLIFIDVYQNNADISLKANRLHRRFSWLRKSHFSRYNSFYIVAKGKIDLQIKEVWSVWDKDDIFQLPTY